MQSEDLVMRFAGEGGQGMVTSAEGLAMAAAGVRGRPGVASALPGVTRPEHVDAILAGGELTLSDDILTAIEAVHTELKNPVV